ncbi:hypothetical protein [Streptomyces canus]|uniref:hypothetical protein n=1 Tax=Streptomyces canus TaxID=58343 RepID=UPI0036E59077
MASPFLAQYLLVQPGRAAGVRIPEVRYEELRAAGAEGRYVPDWLADAARVAWGTGGGPDPGFPADQGGASGPAIT